MICVAMFGNTKMMCIYRRTRCLACMIWFEATNDVLGAIQRELHVIECNWQWKINLIEKENTEWDDLYEELV